MHIDSQVLDDSTEGRGLINGIVIKTNGTNVWLQSHLSIPTLGLWGNIITPNPRGGGGDQWDCNTRLTVLEGITNHKSIKDSVRIIVVTETENHCSTLDQAIMSFFF